MPDAFFLRVQKIIALFQYGIKNISGFYNAYIFNRLTKQHLLDNKGKGEMYVLRKLFEKCFSDNAA